MKYFVLYLLCIVSALFLSGCVVAIGNGGSSAHKCDRACNPSCTPALATITEIDVVGALHTESAKVSRYTAIAQRRNLTCCAQVHLVRSVFEKLHTESSKQHVLVTLINNHAFCTCGKMEIVNRLNKSHTESGKLHILTLIDSRGELPPCSIDTAPEPELEEPTELQ